MVEGQIQRLSIAIVLCMIVHTVQDSLRLQTILQACIPNVSAIILKMVGETMLTQWWPVSN